jgi:hypothetical protein
MSIAMVLVRWLTSQLIIGTQAAFGAAPARQRKNSYAAVQQPLQWRAPWLTSQLLSLFVATLLAPTFWGIGTLLMIDARSDHPFFWPAAMAIVALTNVIAIVCANQRHHRRAFTGRAALAMYYFCVSMLTGGALFLLLGWSTGALHDFAGPMAATQSAVGASAATMLWSLVIAAGFSVLSFTHAGILHAWLAFEAPLPVFEKRRRG